MNCNYKEKIKGSINKHRIRVDKLQIDRIQADGFREISGSISGIEAPANDNE